MSRLRTQLVSLTLLLGLSAFCASMGANPHGLNVSQVGASQPAALLVNESANSQTLFVDGGDPGAPPLPLPGGGPHPHFV